MKKFRKPLVTIFIVFILLLNVALIINYYTLHTEFKELQEIVTTRTARKTAAEIYDEYKTGVVTVVGTNSTTNKNSVGSGFIYKNVDGYYYILTNEHVIRDDDYIAVYSTPENNINFQLRDVEVVGSDKESDIAILRFKSSEQYTILSLLDNGNEITPGETVYSFGTPFNETFAGSISHGVISGTLRPTSASQSDHKKFDSIQTDVTLAGGNSGGPLFDTNGKVIGMNTSILDNFSGMNLSIPSDILREYIFKLEYNFNSGL